VLRQAMEKLSAPMRDIIEQRYFHGRGQREVGVWYVPTDRGMRAALRPRPVSRPSADTPATERLSGGVNESVPPIVSWARSAMATLRAVALHRGTYPARPQGHQPVSQSA
jgi:hypothetical protein